MYRTEADQTNEKLPTGIPHIIGNEAAERFSFYGMKAILAVFLTKYLMDSDGNPDFMDESQASAWVHYFNSAVYITPLIGAIIADYFFGKYRTIIVLSIVYCAGHFALAVDDTRSGVMVGLFLIAVGAGGIKPCVSAHVGDQFGKMNSHMLPKMFSWFYLTINVGAFTSMLATPLILEKMGPHWAFGIPGVLMVLATIVFWIGRNRFVHIPPAGKAFFKEVISEKGRKIAGKLLVIYAFVAMFWALFDQTASQWIFQAQKMDMMVFGVELLPSQMQALNPIFVVILIPVFSYGLYPFLNRFFDLTPLRKISIGFFVSILGFVVPTCLEMSIAAGETPSILWQLLGYVFLTAAEVMISITCLEFSYTQAPKTMKSFIMGLFLASVALGNLFTGLVNQFGDAVANLMGVETFSKVAYFTFFTVCISITSVCFLFVVRSYKVDHQTD